MVNEITNDGMKLMPPAPMPDYKKVIRTRVIEFNKEFKKDARLVSIKRED